MKLAIFGCGTIANRVAKGCLHVEEIDLVGFASKDMVKARTYSQRYGCREYGDYDHFLNGDVDAVYLCLYNPGHFEMIKRCIEHHKAVMCEKPMLFDLNENKEAFALARENDVLLMEALKSVFLPSIKEVKRMVKEKEIGDVKKITASFMRNGSHSEDHWINDLHSGGAFKDLGSYCVGTMNYIMDIRPALVALDTDRTEERAESTAHAILDYGGIRGEAHVSNSMDGGNSLRIEGSHGYIEVDNFWKQGVIVYDTGTGMQVKNIDLVSDFYYELKHFASLVEQGKKISDVMSEEASENILRITEEAGY